MSNLSRKQVSVILLLTFARILVSLLDLIGIAVIGVLVAQATNVPGGESNFISLWGLQDTNGLSQLAIATIAVGFFILKSILSIAFSAATAKFLAGVESNLANKAFGNLMGAPITKGKEFSRPEILNGLTVSFNMAFSQSINSATQVIAETSLLVLVSGYLLVSNPIAFISISLVLGLAGVFVHFIISRPLHRAVRNLHSGNLASQSEIIDTLDNQKAILVLKRLDSFSSAFQKVRTKAAIGNFQYATITIMPRYITEITVLISISLLVALHAGLKIIDMATVAIFIAGIFRMVASILPLQTQGAYLKRVKIESEIALRMMARHRDSLSNTAVSAGNPGLAVEARNLNFNYEGHKQVLDDLSFEIPKGAFVAITGESGAGKSTLADLMLGLLKPTSGDIFLEGVTAAECLLDPKSRVAYVPQRTHLIQGNLIENITLTKNEESVDLEKVYEAAIASDLIEFIGQLEMGLFTQFNNARLVSGGQAQRIGLARALYSNPTILILDEATSSLDLKSEKSITSTISALKKKLTLIVIAHRPETILNADFELRIESGKLIKVQTHKK